MVEAKYDDVSEGEVNVATVANVLLLAIGSTHEAQRNMSIKLVSPTIAIVKMAASRRNKWMSLKRLLIFMISSEKYWKDTKD